MRCDLGSLRLLGTVDEPIRAIAAFVTIREGFQGNAVLQDELKPHVAKKIGSLARPDDLLFSAELPKTRSGKDHAPAA